jgi:uncharacterized membrane protein
VTSFTLALAGWGVSAYLTVAHYAGKQLLVCASNSVINCEQVTTSAQSRVLGVPVALLGLVGYAICAGLCSPWGWRSPWRWVHVARVGLVAGSLGFVLWLVTAEVVIIKALCLWCTSVHLITLALALVLTRLTREELGLATNASPGE